MKSLNILGMECNLTKKVQLVAPGLGFDIIMQFDKGALIEPDGYVETVHNCRWFDYLPDSIYHENGVTCFDSPIHCNSGSRHNDDILISVEVRFATTLHHSYQSMSFDDMELDVVQYENEADIDLNKLRL